MEFSYDYDYSFNYNYTEDYNQATCIKDRLCMTVLVVYVVIFLLGFCGNALVIWISGFKMKKTVNTTWYLSLAISDFVFCTSLPFRIAYMVMEDWIFGSFMCKFASSVIFLNMFSSISLLVVMSIDRCVSIMFPVWAQNHRTVKKASAVVVVSWLFAVALSFPFALFQEVSTYMGRTFCYRHSHMMVAMTPHAGFFVSFAIIIICYSFIILRLRKSRILKTSKPFRVMSALVAAFFICWLPYHVAFLLVMNHQNLDHRMLDIALIVGIIMAAAHSFLNPVLYVFMGIDFKQKFKCSVLSKMENAMGEEGHTTISQYMSSTSSMDGRASTQM